MNPFLKRYIGHFFLLSANLIYGINFTVAKIPMPHYIKPFGFVLLRSTTAVLFFWLIASSLQKNQKQKIQPKDFGLFLLCGLFGICLNQLLFFQGLEYTTPINGAIIMTLSPIIIIIVAYFFHKEKITLPKIVGITLGLLGALLLIMNGKQESTPYASNPTLGNLLVFINATSYAIYLNLVKPLLKKYDPILVLKWVFLFGFLLTLPFGYEQVLHANYAEMNYEVIAAILFVLIFVSCLTYLFNLIALKNLSPSVVGSYIYSQPFFATLFAIAMQKDHLDYIKFFSAALIFMGVFLVSNSFKKVKK